MNSLDVQDWELVPNDGFLDDGESNRNTQLALEPTSPKLQEQREADHSPTPSEDEEEECVQQVFFKTLKDGRAEFHFEQGKSKADLEESRDSFNIWKLGLFGVAAAGVYIIISWGNSNKQHQQNQKNHRRT